MQPLPFRLLSKKPKESGCTDNDDGSAYYNTHHVRVILSRFVCCPSLANLRSITIADDDAYDKLYENKYDWCKTTLQSHAADPRPVHYTREQMEQAQTADDLWNAAQNEMVLTGKFRKDLWDDDRTQQRFAVKGTTENGLERSSRTRSL